MDKPATLSQQVAKAIESEMARSALSLNVVAERSGIPRSTLSRRLIGASPFTLSEVEALAQVFGVARSKLLSGAAS